MSGHKIIRTPWDDDPAPVEPVAKEGKREGGAEKRQGRRPKYLAPLAPVSSPDWLFFELTVSGPATGVQNFAAAARGPGIVPWQLDFAAIEEYIFNMAAAVPAAQRGLTIAGCRILARQFRERVEARQARVAARLDRSQTSSGQGAARATYDAQPVNSGDAGAADRTKTCPFDLQTLLPVPAQILRLGPNDPAALRWLVQNWGVEGLRQVKDLAKPTTGKRLKRSDSVIGYRFCSADTAPDAAIATLTKAWPALRFSLQQQRLD